MKLINRKAVFSILLVALILLAIVPGVSAFTAQITPTTDDIAVDGTIYVGVDNLVDGNTFKYRIQ